MIKKQINYLVLRFPKYTQQKLSLIDEHIAVVKEYGSVAYGKIGRPLAIPRIREMTENIATGKCEIFLVSTIPRSRTYYKATVLDTMRVLSPKYKRIVPKYYKKEKIDTLISSWLVLKDIRPTTEIERGAFITVTGFSDLIDALNKSMAGFFVVRRSSSRVHAVPLEEAI